MTSDIWIGTAGWSIPRAAASRFDSAGTHLQRYSNRFTCTEINSSFHRPHTAATYAKWRDSTPPGFRFAIKMPRAITHELKLCGTREPLAAFLGQTDGLGPKRGPILVQLPPSLAFDSDVVSAFLELLRSMHAGPVVCEPRHPTWFAPPVAALLDEYGVSLVAADPPPAPAAAVRPGRSRLTYFRLHGSPRMYWSTYDATWIASLSTMVATLQGVTEVWCIFDNPAGGGAIENAGQLRDQLLAGATRERSTIRG
jgi:uncharacterized protein YecE (DUF72 family)